MIDSIGLGEAIANIIYWTVFSIALIGGVILIAIKKKFLALIWLSVFINILSFLYFMGARNLSVFFVNDILWPVLNIILIVWYFKTKSKK